MEAEESKTNKRSDNKRSQNQLLTSVDYSLSDLQTEKADRLYDQQSYLRNRVAELEKEMEIRRKENGILKMNAIISLGTMQLQIEGLEEDKRCLLEKCKKIERKIRKMKIPHGAADQPSCDFQKNFRTER